MKSNSIVTKIHFLNFSDTVFSTKAYLITESMARSRCNSEIKPPNTLRLFPSDDIITLSTVRNQERPNDVSHILIT